MLHFAILLRFKQFTAVTVGNGYLAMCWTDVVSRRYFRVLNLALFFYRSSNVKK